MTVEAPQEPATDLPKDVSMKRPADCTGDLKVKPEYKRMRVEEEQVDIPRDDRDTPRDRDATGGGRGDKKKKQKRGGQNKQRHIKKSFDKVNLCLYTAQGTDCTNEKCKKVHDVALFMESREPDLGTECPLFNLLGACRFGIKCRYAGAHTADGKQVKKDVVNYERDFVKNLMPDDFQRSLRGTERDLPRSKEFKVWWETVGKEESAVVHKPKVCKEEVAVECEGAVMEVKVEGEVQEVKVKDKGVSNVEVKDKDPIHKSDEIKVGEVTLKSEPVTEKGDEVKDPATVESIDQEPPTVETTLPVEATNDESLNEIEVPDHGPIKLRQVEKKRIDFRGKSYLAPLTTVGNLPFRRICKEWGVDVTCGEMALTDNLKRGAAQEWALARRHASEDIFGIQIAGSFPVEFAETCEMIQQNIDIGTST
jgi:tRNA-dihydrouridine synthase 3